MHRCCGFEDVCWYDIVADFDDGSPFDGLAFEGETSCDQRNLGVTRVCFFSDLLGGLTLDVSAA